MKIIIFLSFIVISTIFAIKETSSLRIRNANKFRTRLTMRSRAGTKVVPRWVAILSNKRMRGFGIKVLRGKFDWEDFGFVINSDNVDEEVQSIITNAREVSKAINTLSKFESLGLYHLKHGRKPTPEDDSEIDKKMSEFHKKNEEIIHVDNTDLVASYRLFEDCKFSWVPSLDQSVSEKRGIQGNILSNDKGFLSQNCKPSLLNFYDISIFPNARFDPTSVHQPDNIDKITGFCNTQREKLKNNIKIYLDKYQTVLDIAELKRKHVRLNDDLQISIKNFGLRLEKFSDLWAGIGLESSSIQNWLGEIREAILTKDENFEFSHADQIYELLTPGLIQENEKKKAEQGPNDSDI